MKKTQNSARTHTDIEIMSRANSSVNLERVEQEALYNILDYIREKMNTFEMINEEKKLYCGSPLGKNELIIKLEEEVKQKMAENQIKNEFSGRRIEE